MLLPTVAASGCRRPAQSAGPSDLQILQILLNRDPPTLAPLSHLPRLSGGMPTLGWKIEDRRPAAFRSHRVAMLYTGPCTLSPPPPPSHQYPHLPFLIPPVPCLPRDLYTGFAHSLLLENCPTWCLCTSPEEALPPPASWSFSCESAMVLAQGQNALTSSPHKSHPTSTETYIQKVLKQWLCNKGKKIKGHLQPRIPWPGYGAGNQEASSCQQEPLCTPHLSGSQPYKNHRLHLALG